MDHADQSHRYTGFSSPFVIFAEAGAVTNSCESVLNNSTAQKKSKTLGGLWQQHENQSNHYLAFHHLGRDV